MTDVEALVCSWLAARLDGIRVVNVLPAGFDRALPVVQVTTLPGPKTQRPWNGPAPLVWTPRVDVDVYATDRATAYDTAAQVSRHVHGLRGGGNEWGYVAAVDEAAGPAWRPDYNSNVRRVGLTIALTVRAE